MIPVRNLKRFISKFFKQPFYAVSVASKRVSAYLSYLFAGGKSSFPESMTLFMTHRCNLRCKMCGQWGESGVTKEMACEEVRAELSWETFESLIDDLSRRKTSMTLFGGEPLLNAHCIKLIRYIKSKGMHCLMITNGSLLERYAQEIVDAQLDELNISFDGGQELHDEIRGLPGLYDRIMKGIQKVNEYKKEKGVSRPYINLQCTITKYNYHHLDQLITVANEISANSLTYHNLIFLNQEAMKKQKEDDEHLCCSSRDWEGFVSEPEIDPDVLFQNLQQISSQTHNFGVDVYPNFSQKGLTDYYTNPNYQPKEYSRRCLSPWMAAYIFPDGEIRPCLNSSFSFGNIKTDRFGKIWNSEKSREFRSHLKKKKIFSACIRCTELYRY